MLVVFGLLIILSGLICEDLRTRLKRRHRGFTLEQHWYKGMSAIMKASQAPDLLTIAELGARVHDLGHQRGLRPSEWASKHHLKP